MTKISQTKKFRRDICKTADHDWKPAQGQTSTKGWAGERCARCKKKRVITEWSMVGRVNIPTSPINVKPAILYKDIKVKRYNILDRAKERLNKPEEL